MKLTIVRTTAIPEKTRCVRLSSGKCGSMIPVTGLRATVGANAAKVGLGLSYKTIINRNKVHLNFRLDTRNCIFKINTWMD